MNNRLDFISEFEDKEAAMREMIQCRKDYIAIDDILRSYLNKPVSPALARCVALARTNLEQALQYSIKALCLLHEKKPNISVLSEDGC